MYYQKVKRNIQCTLCPHECILHEGKFGLCGVRQNIGGKIKCSVYGKISGYAFDPIEKKPLYHFYPGAKILSIGSYGCNLKCNFCQNWQISLACKAHDIPNTKNKPSNIIHDALAEPNNIGVAFTYNEPTVWFEFMHEIAIASHNKGLKNVMVTNGYISKEPLYDLLNLIDAFNVELKAFTDSFYKEMTGGSLQPVLNTLKSIGKSGKHLEITNLVIPHKNDDLNVFSAMIDWIHSELGSNTVLHLSRYFPNYKQSLPSTPEDTLLRMHEIASRKLNYVYLGNVSNAEFSTSRCAKCKSKLIERNAYQLKLSHLYDKGLCLNCGEQIAEDSYLNKE